MIVARNVLGIRTGDPVDNMPIFISWLARERGAL